MATKPGIFSDWPWKSIGNFKYLVLAPFVVHSITTLIIQKGKTDEYLYHLILPYTIARMIHHQVWISFSRYQTARGRNRIVERGFDFDQVDRESNWIDQLILTGLMYYIGIIIFRKEAKEIPIWRTDGVILTFLVHAGPVEFLYYWLHRALHHHYLYSRYHSHHHSSIVPEPITSLVHPFAEVMAYLALASIPILTVLCVGKTSMVALLGYIVYIDFMNDMGHCNFEFIPSWIYSVFPPLKYLMYNPSFHSLHHTQFRTNYSLFMPIYDYIYNTVDKNTETLYHNSLKKKEEAPSAVHLTHLTTMNSIYHVELGFASLASRPETCTSKWYLWMLWPITLVSSIITRLCGNSAVVLEKNYFDSHKLQSWLIPRYSFQYYMEGQREKMNRLIEEAIVDADKKGVKVLSLGLLNQGEKMNKNGEIYVERNPNLKIRVVDGSSLAVAIVVNSIPEGTTQVLLAGKPTKVAYAIASALCKKGIQVVTADKHDHEKLKLRLTTVALGSDPCLVHSDSYTQKVWLVGDDVSEKQQSKAQKGTLFIPFSQFPPKKSRHDCFYHSTPAMKAPKAFENLHSCENWLERGVVSAWRIAGVVHALEEWNVHECGLYDTFHIDKVWDACLRHGFRPLHVPP